MDDSRFNDIFNGDFDGNYDNVMNRIVDHINYPSCEGSGASFSGAGDDSDGNNADDSNNDSDDDDDDDSCRTSPARRCGDFSLLCWICSLGVAT